MLNDDPLIAGMAIDCPLPLHDSSRRLRGLYPACPRVYGVAVLADVCRRRWWPLASALTTDRLQVMFDNAAADMDRRAAARQLADTLVHTVIGRVVALVVLEGRAWDPAWRTYGSMSTPRARSTGSRSSTPRCAGWLTTRNCGSRWCGCPANPRSPYG
ncbi:hypothetical protein I552_6349 [Mycobacterium xenopi 3993]|nr:hypothetical protein I552_6349 [Mycobacterium xenopi 3993]